MSPRILVIAVALAVSPLGAHAADPIPLPDGAYGLVPLSGEVTGLAPLCPPGATCVVNGVIATLTFQLRGCVDRLILDYGYDPAARVLAVSAINVETTASTVTECDALPRASREVSLPGARRDVKIMFVGTGEIALVRVGP